MNPFKKPVAAKELPLRAPKGRAVPKAAAKRASLKKRPAVTHSAPHVSVITAGGYTVFGSPVRPAHLTTEQIAEAIAELD